MARTLRSGSGALAAKDRDASPAKSDSSRWEIEKDLKGALSVPLPWASTLTFDSQNILYTMKREKVVTYRL